MKMEYLPDGPGARALVRLYDFTLDDAKRLHAACRALAVSSMEQIDLNAQEWIEPIGAFRLSLGLAHSDSGLATRADGGRSWLLRCETWDNVHGLVDPFTHGARGFQWLDERNGVSLLLSFDGLW